MSIAAEVSALFETVETPIKSRSFEGIREELSVYIAEMKGLNRMFPDEAMAWLSSVSARILEMIIQTLDNDNRLTTKFRVEVLIPLRDELRFQFQIASRRHSVDKMEYDLARGQET